MPQTHVNARLAFVKVLRKKCIYLADLILFQLHMDSLHVTVSLKSNRD